MKSSVCILGLGKRATLFYQKELATRLLNEGGDPIHLVHADFDQINPYMPDNHLVIKKKLKPSIQEIIEKGFSHVIVPNITMHKILDEMELPFQLIHPIELLQRKLASCKLPIMILGTRHTSKNSFIGKAVTDRGFEVISAEEATIKQVDEFRVRMYDMNETDKEIIEFNTLVRRLSYSFTVVVACTELTIANLHSDKILDLGQFQIEEAVRLMLQAAQS